MSAGTTARPTTAPPLPVIATLSQRELVRFFRQKNRVFGALGQPIIFWLLFGAGLGTAKVDSAEGGSAAGASLDYAHFFPGTLVMILLFTAIFATISIIEDRREGFLQGVLVAPTPRWAMVMGKVLGGSAIAMLQGIIFLFLGWLTGALGWYQVINPASVVSVVAAIVLMLVISLALTSLGFLIAWRMDSTQGFHAIMSVFLLPMWLLSGAFFPMDVGGWLGWIVRINPLTYGVAGLRHYLQNANVAGLPSLGVSWAVSLAFAAVIFAAAWWIAGTRSTGDLL